MFFNAALTVVAFSGSCGPSARPCSLVAVAYAALGSAVTVYSDAAGPAQRRPARQGGQFPRPSGACPGERRVRGPVTAREPLKARLLSRLDALIDNLRLIIDVNRNLGFFTTGYNYLIQIIPALVVAPLFIAGRSSSASSLRPRWPSRTCSGPFRLS